MRTPFESAGRALTKLAALLSAAAILTQARVAHAELLTLERAIQLARARAIAVAEAEAEVGVANAQMAGARASALGNPYTDVQVDRAWDTIPGTVQALTYTYFPLDVAGQRG